jgi:hypothetical protein
VDWIVSYSTCRIIRTTPRNGPFFSGSAGAGMSWHWDSYVEKNNLWYHFKRFSEAVKDIDPVKERFVASKSETNDFRLYILNGRKTILIWLRDKKNTWESELRDRVPPQEYAGIQLDMRNIGIKEFLEEISIYDPWQNRWENTRTDGLKMFLPDFKRSLVIRIIKQN